MLSFSVVASLFIYPKIEGFKRNFVVVAPGDESMIIAVSDVHLGYRFADAAQFEDFLKNVANDDEVNHLVLLGDMIDLWRREPIKVFFEYWDVINDFKNFKPKVHYIIGNHDYHMIKLKQYLFQHLGLDVSADITLNDGNAVYYFIHGYQYEWGDKLALFNKFADILSLADDEIGEDADRLWEFYNDLTPSVLRWIKNFIIPDVGKDALKRPGERLTENILNEIEEKALEDLGKRPEKPFLVYGHTHRPKVDKENRIANTGSWVDDPNLPTVTKNTYVKIDGDDVEMRGYP